MTIRIAIVDDQALVRGGLSMILDNDADIEVIAECSNGLEAVATAKQQIPDLMLMDIRMPDMDGLAALSVILEEEKLPIKIIILSTFDLDEYIYKALQHGASGFILKDTPPEDLVNAVKTVANGGALLTPSITKKLINTFASLQQVDKALATRLESLTDREKEILRTLALGLSNSEIGEKLFIGETTVKSHVSSILGKLDLRDRAQAVIFAYESGLVTIGQSDLNL